LLCTVSVRLNPPVTAVPYFKFLFLLQFFMTETFSVLENTLRAYATSSKQAQGEVVVWRHPFLIMVLFGQLHVSLVLPRIKGPRCPSNRRLNGPQIWCERGEKKKKSSCPCRDFFFFRTLHRPARSIVTVLTELSRLLYVIQCFCRRLPTGITVIKRKTTGKLDMQHA